jgi:predicted nucleotidyltransferase
MNDLSSIREELDTLTAIITATVPVAEIYLFGSYAYGTPHQDSDLDLYVVLKDDVQMRLIDAVINIRLAIGRDKSMPVDILTNKYQRFQELTENATMERQIAREGIKIYG